MPELKKWSLKETMEGPLYANGNVYGHYRLEDGDYIYTSYIVNYYDLGNGEYAVETYSGSLYQLQEGEMQGELRENTKRLLENVEWKNADGMKEKIAIANREFEKKRETREQIINNAESRAEANLGNGELYLVMESMKVLKALYKQEEQLYELHEKVHLGMFQDSVMITDWEHGTVDFRFFPNSRIEPYHWSDGLEKIHIHNAGAKAIYFKGTEEEIRCEAGKITVVDKSAYRGEGLFSPDVVNGKCMFFSGENPEEDNNGSLK